MIYQLLAWLVRYPWLFKALSELVVFVNRLRGKGQYRHGR